MNVIETVGLSKRYRNILAVDAISIQVERGQIFGFLGPNGSGKTTTIGMLLGIITPTGGSFRLLGLDGRKGLHEAWRRVGATLETPNFYPYLSGLDNLKIVANVKRVGRKQIDETLELVGLTERRKDTFRKYSLGMKQRLALAATMLGDPELIILDEPANGLDPEGMREIREIILRLAEHGKTIFLSSHLLWEVERTCTHVAIISKGRILRQTSVRELLTGSVFAGVRAENMTALEAALRAYPDGLSVARQGDLLVVELKQDDLAALNRYLASHDIYASHIAHQRASLEQIFLELTGSTPEQEMAGAA